SYPYRDYGVALRARVRQADSHPRRRQPVAAAEACAKRERTGRGVCEGARKVRSAVPTALSSEQILQCCFQGGEPELKSAFNELFRLNSRTSKQPFFSELSQRKLCGKRRQRQD